MDTFRFPAVGDALGAWPVLDVGEGVIGHSILDAELAQLVRQPVMPVAVDLQPAGQPSRHPHMTQAEFFAHEVEVVVQTLAVIRKQIRLAGLLVVPRLVGGAWLDRREDAHQPSLLPLFRQDLLHTIFLPEVALADELDLDASVRRHLFSVLPNPVPKRVGELRVVEDANFPLKQKRRHSPCKADPRQGAKNNIRSQQPNTPAICAAYAGLGAAQCGPLGVSPPQPCVGYIFYVRFELRIGQPGVFANERKFFFLAGGMLLAGSKSTLNVPQRLHG